MAANERSEFLPNAFYDLIVFASSTVTAGATFAIGMGWLNWQSVSDASTFDVVLLGIGIAIVGYEYGRIAETWSSVIVQAPLRFLNRRGIGFTSADFLYEDPNVDEMLGLPRNSSGKSGGKWAIYYYATVVDARLGTDLLKRYAWEKLARNSGFNFAILALISITIGCLRMIGIDMPFEGIWAFGGVAYSSVLCLMVVITYYEYYKRNCWNADLIRRVLPVLRQAEKIHGTNRTELVVTLRTVETGDDGKEDVVTRQHPRRPKSP